MTIEIYKPDLKEFLDIAVEAKRAYWDANRDVELMFSDDDGDFSPEWQISAILDRLSQEIYDSGVNMGPKGALRDTNGNLVGEWGIEE